MNETDNPLLGGEQVVDDEHFALAQKYETPFLRALRNGMAERLYEHCRSRYPHPASLPSWRDLTEQEQETYIRQFWWS